MTLECLVGFGFFLCVRARRLSFWVTQYFQLRNYDFSEDTASVLPYCNIYFKSFFPVLFSVLLFLIIAKDSALSFWIQTIFNLIQRSHFFDWSSNQQSCLGKISSLAFMRHKMMEHFCTLIQSPQTLIRAKLFLSLPFYFSSKKPRDWVYLDCSFCCIILLFSPI